MIPIARIFSTRIFSGSIRPSLSCRYISKIEIKSEQSQREKLQKPIEIETLKQSIQKFNDKTPKKFMKTSMKNFIYLSEKDEEIDFILEYFEKNPLLKNQFRFLKSDLINQLFHLKKTEKLIDLIRNNNNFYNSQFDLQNIMIKFFHLKQYNEIVITYDLLNDDGKKFNLSFVTKALLLINTKESFEKMKEIVNIRAKNDPKFPVNSVINIFLLAFNQKQYEFANNFLNFAPFDEPTNIVIKNCQSIVFSNLNKLEESLAIIESIQEKNDWYMFDLEKKFFKLTLETFQKSAQNNKDLLQKFETIYGQIIKSNQLNEVDLFELATEYKALKKPENIKEKPQQKPKEVIKPQNAGAKKNMQTTFKPFLKPLAQNKLSKNITNTKSLENQTV